MHMCAYMHYMSTQSAPPFTPTRDPREAAAQHLAALLDAELFRALSDPGRMAVLRRLIVTGATSIAEIGAGLPQDRSVVSRHLARLEAAGVARSQRIGRTVIYELDGPELVARLQALLAAAQALCAHCCPTLPADAPLPQETRHDRCP